MTPDSVYLHSLFCLDVCIGYAVIAEFDKHYYFLSRTGQCEIIPDSDADDVLDFAARGSYPVEDWTQFTRWM